MTHRIRLRRPWTREIFCDGQSVHRAERMDVPDTSGASEVPTGNDVPGQATRSEYHAIYRRHFNCPTGLEDGDQVLIEIDPEPNLRFVVRLNDQEIGGNDLVGLTVETAREAIRLPLPTPLLGQNQIEIELRSDEASRPPRCVSEVALRIDAAV